MPSPKQKLATLQRRASRLPSYKENLKAYQADRAPIGAMPPDPSYAWWYLSRQAKALLLKERLAGRFGGIQGQAPYWLVQEKGSPGARVQAQFYIKHAVDYWRSTLGNEIRQWIGAYSFSEQAQFPEEFK